MRIETTGSSARKRGRLQGGLAAAGLGVGMAVSGCGAGTAPPRAEVQMMWDPPAGSELVFDGNVTYQGGNWPMNCYSDNPGRLEAVTAQEGDTLLTLANRAGTLLVQSTSLRGTDIPADVFAAPLAHLNDLDDPDVIYAGTQYVFPDICRLG